MCGRYFLAQSKQDQPSDELSRIIAALNRKKTPASLKTSGEIFPSDIVPVLANNRQMEIEPFAMRWGYSFPNSRPIINARSETALQKHFSKTVCYSDVASSLQAIILSGDGAITVRR